MSVKINFLNTWNVHIASNLNKFRIFLIDAKLLLTFWYIHNNLQIISFESSAKCKPNS